MDKPFIKKVLAVLLGISLVILVYETIASVVGVVSLNDMQTIQGYLNDLEAFIKWSMVGLICMLVPALASYVFAFLSKNKNFVLISAILSFVITVCCVTFLCVAHSYSMRGFSGSLYAEGVSFFSIFIQIGTAAALVGTYFLTAFLSRVKKERAVEEIPAEAAEQADSQTEEVENEEN